MKEGLVLDGELRIPIVLRPLRTPIRNNWLRFGDLASAQAVRRPARHACSRRAGRARQIADHCGTRVARDDSSVSAEAHAREIGA